MQEWLDTVVSRLIRESILAKNQGNVPIALKKLQTISEILAKFEGSKLLRNHNEIAFKSLKLFLNFLAAALSKSGVSIISLPFFFNNFLSLSKKFSGFG